MKYKNKRLTIVNKIKDIAGNIGVLSDKFVESKLLSICHELLKVKKPLNSGGVKSGKKKTTEWLYGYNGSGDWKLIGTDPIKPLNLCHTTTHRNELRQTEKEIMIENKINEIISYLNTK